MSLLPLVAELNTRLIKVDAAIFEALEKLNELRALHGKIALTPNDFMAFYRGQRIVENDFGG